MTRKCRLSTAQLLALKRLVRFGLRSISLCVFGTTLVACGFHPIYGTHDNGTTSTASEMNSVAIAGIKDKEGQELRNDLIDRMYGKGRPAQPLYTLDVGLHYTEEDLGIQANTNATRSLLNMFADYTLKDHDQKIILKGSAHSVASFEILTQQYGTLSAREDAKERTINEVSNQIVNRLSLFFAERKTTPPEVAK